MHVTWMVFQPPRGRCCFLVQLLSVISLSLRLCYMVLSFRSIGSAQKKIKIAGCASEPRLRLLVAGSELAKQINLET